MVTILVALLLAVCIILKRKKCSKNDTKENATYECVQEVLPNVKMEDNICYTKGAKQEPEYAEIECNIDIIKTRSNEAYETVQALQTSI